MTHAIVNAIGLRDLWLHTGTACNLECPFCLEGSKPGDTRLQSVTLADLKPHLDEAVQLGVERFIFTGGEPLIVKEIVKILSYALQFTPCLVLTNGTAPLIKRAHQLELLKRQPHALAFRVSIDRPNADSHDKDRGWGNFKRAMEGTRLLLQAGFDVSIARHADLGEDGNDVVARYRELLSKHGLPSDLRLVAWPELGRLGGVPDIALPTPEETALSSHRPMCRDTRMILKREDQVRVFACALTDDNAQFDLGPSLTAGLAAPIALSHHRCGQCIRRGASLG